ncbi:hypothetical protein [uncultured Duncaniella sp.]|uniref:hypothetical protein n=1 Tax=uncultured Duncaniella sp. TaxID=2768039 RepID=UPI0026312A8A|nr:hypothetical protein [uncultured Duncaniella sp.]
MMNEGTIMVAVWKAYGLNLVKEVEDKENNRLILFIDVPETSDKLNAHGEQMAGDVLARRFKEVLTEQGLRVQVRRRIIKGLHWTEEIGKSVMDKELTKQFPYQNIPGVNT